MKKTISKSEFCQAFVDSNRESNFSHAGREALYDYLEEVQPDFELDVIALCCEFAEYENLAEFQKDYDFDDYKSIRDVEDYTTVIKIDVEAFIIQQF
jgi:hypothetical protein